MIITQVLGGVENTGMDNPEKEGVQKWRCFGNILTVPLFIFLFLCKIKVCLNTREKILKGYEMA